MIQRCQLSWSAKLCQIGQGSGGIQTGYAHEAEHCPLTISSSTIFPHPANHIDQGHDRVPGLNLDRTSSNFICKPELVDILDETLGEFEKSN